MNIVKLQNELKNVPDQALIGYVQNPTGQVPSYLALSELQRRKEMREKYQTEKAPETSVAEDLEQQAQPSGLAMLAKNPMPGASSPAPEGAPTSQGVAGLPVPDEMYQDQNFAAGGIVAFADGGVATSRIGEYFGGIRAANLAQQDIDKQLNQLISEKARLKYDIFTPLTTEQKAAQQNTITQIDSMIANLQAQKASPATAPTASTGGPRDVMPAQLPPSFTGMGTQSQFGVSPGAISQMGSAPQAPVAKVAGPDFGGLYQPLTDYSKEYAALYQDPTGMAEKEMARYKELIGEDKMRPQLEEKLRKMEERSAKAEEQAPWMALARAGLGMAAGKSRYALQNIAEGATMGLEDYNKAKDRLESSREKQFDLQTRIAQAQRAEQVAAATHGINSEQHIKAQNQANKLAELNYKVNREAANQKNKIDAFEATQKGKLYGAQAEYYGEKGPSGEVTEKDLWKGYISSGGEVVNGPWEVYKQKFAPKAIPQDINSLVSKYTK